MGERIITNGPGKKELFHRIGMKKNPNGLAISAPGLHITGQIQN
jgi:hypothetical protein